MPVERQKAVKLRGNEFTLIGPELKVGDKAPDFSAVGRDMKMVTLKETEGAARIFSVVPSLDTPVCDAQTRRFNDEASRLPNVRVYTISMDLPFAQSRWCAAAGVQNVTMLSDHRNASFGAHYGTLIKELRLNCRALFVIDEKNTIRHAEYVKEVSEHADYERALAVVRKLAS
ncbi:MAG: thiol peroxidase [Acidobacteria bacterium]|nr:thiol peroxidase [Acidobacteriota bacterium]